MVFSKVRETGSLLNSKYGIILYLVKSVYVQERIQTGKKQEKKTCLHQNVINGYLSVELQGFCSSIFTL